MAENCFKTFIEFLDEEESKFFTQDICDFQVPINLAIWNEEVEDFLYISKNDLRNYFDGSEVELQKLYKDINATIDDRRQLELLFNDN
jgi:hypothetical protein